MTATGEMMDNSPHTTDEPAAPAQSPPHPMPEQSSPALKNGQNVIAPRLKPRKKWPPSALLTCVAIIILGGDISAISKLHRSAIPLDCVPPAGSSVNRANAVDAFMLFSTAIKQKSQTCANMLSSNYFEQSQDATYSGSNGYWVTYTQNGLPTMASRFAQLPSALRSSSFTQSGYTEATVIGPSSQFGSANVKGLTLTYPLNADHVQYDLNVSFVAQKGKVLVDALQLIPAALENQLNNSSVPGY
jgi:hypothetical protein